VSERTHAARKGHIRSASLSTAADIHTLLKVRFGPIADITRTRGLLPYVGPAERHRLDLGPDALALRKAQLLPGLLGYARQEARAGAFLTQGHGC
jgi:hypothetical protein